MNCAGKIGFAAAFYSVMTVSICVGQESFDIDRFHEILKLDAKQMIFSINENDIQTIIYFNIVETNNNYEIEILNPNNYGVYLLNNYYVLLKLFEVSNCSHNYPTGRYVYRLNIDGVRNNFNLQVESTP